MMSKDTISTMIVASTPAYSNSNSLLCSDLLELDKNCCLIVDSIEQGPLLQDAACDVIDVI